MRKIKIVTDSSSDILTVEGIDFESAPLKIVTTEKIYIDDATLNVEEMVNDLATYKGKSSTSCPNPDDYIRAFGDADEVYCTTITGSLSGSYNSAVLAKNTYEAEHEGRRVYVLNSLSTGPEMALIIERMRSLILDGRTFTCFPSRKDSIGTKGTWVDELVVQDGNVLTSQGPGTTLHFAYAIVDALGGDGDKLRKGMLYSKVLAQ